MGGAWVERQKLLAADGVAGDIFGISVDLDGDTAAIGSSSHSAAGYRAGAVYVFERSAGAFVQVQKLIASDPRSRSCWRTTPTRPTTSAST